MRLFDLERIEDVSGISGNGVVAQGVEFDDGTIVMRWVTAHRSTSFYSSEKDLIAIHGHAGRTVVRWRVRENWFDRGVQDAALDTIENCPWGSVTEGPAIACSPKPAAFVTPDYVSTGDSAEYLRGYCFQMRDLP